MAQTILFNTSQSMAITHGYGPALVIAGPGSGKTAVIIARIRYLIHKLNISPENILVLTFTRKAAGEMRSRFAADNPENVTFGTFHSVFWNILKQETSLQENSILKEWEQRIIIRRCLLEIGRMGYTKLSENIIRTLTDEEIDDYISAISLLENSSGIKHRIDKKSSEKTKKQDELMPEKYLLRKLYTSEKRSLNKVDYDDMALLCGKLLLENPEIRAKWQKKYPLILVDEFQDINMSQYRVLEILGSPHYGGSGNIFVVGDDDQAIYGFRGSDPLYMSKFINDNEGTVKYVLDTNYRCAGKIIAMGNRLIENNINRISKKIIAGRNEQGTVAFLKCENASSESRMILDDISELHKKGVNYSDIAVLTRTNRELYRIENLAAAKGIPCRGDKGGHSWKSQEMVRDLAAYISLAVGPVRRSDFIRIMNKPLRYLDRNPLSSEILNWDELIREYSGPEYSPEAGNAVSKMRQDLVNITKLSPEMILPYLIRIAGYDRRNPELEAYIRGQAAGFTDIVSFLNFLRDDTEQTNRKGITLTTYHGSKGLEFKIVFLPGLIKGTVPSPNAVSAEQLEEERRMFYVAITRARDKLILSYPEMSGGKQKTSSPFLVEIAESGG